LIFTSKKIAIEYIKIVKEWNVKTGNNHAKVLQEFGNWLRLK
jgi:hypothetical protein